MKLVKLIRTTNEGNEIEIEAELRQYFPEEKVVVLSALAPKLVVEMLWDSAEKAYIYKSDNLQLKTPKGVEYSETKYVTNVIRSQRKSRPNR